MDLSFYKKKYEPIEGKWYFNKELGNGAFGKVYEIERRDFTNDKSALKIITIPSSSSEIKSYREENYELDEKSISSYFYGFVEEFTKEFSLMTTLKGQNNIVRIEDYDVKEHEDEIGWDIFIRMELLTPMSKHFSQQAPTEQDIIRLGIDICKALEVCKNFNIIHRDIKPSNIFISKTGEYKLGDFGVARTLEKTSSGLSKKGTYTYMAPEVFKGESYGANVDIYSLGIVMYKLLNNNMEPYRTEKTHTDEEKALSMRMCGETMPLPANADSRLGKIVLKACSFNPTDRYESPSTMREELEALLRVNNEEKINFIKADVIQHNTTADTVHSASEYEKPIEDQTVGLFTRATKTFNEELCNEILNATPTYETDDITKENVPQDPQEPQTPVYQNTTATGEQYDNVKPAVQKNKKFPWAILIALFGVIAFLFITIIGIIIGVVTWGNSLEPIEYVDVIIDSPIVGETPNDLYLSADDAEQYRIELDYCYYYDDSNVYTEMSNSDVFDFDTDYYIRFQVIPLDGYKLDDSTQYTVSGTDTTCYGTDSQGNEAYREIIITSYDPDREKISVSYQFAGEQTSLNGYDTSYIELNEPVENCISFVTEFEITSMNSGTPYRNWDIFVRQLNGEFWKVNTFNYYEDNTYSVETYFDTPATFDAVAVIPSENVEMNWNHNIDVTNVIVKRQ